MATKNNSFKRNPKYELWRYKVFGITWLAYAGFYLTRASFSVAKIGIADDPNINLTIEQMGIIDGIYLIGYSVGMFIWGILGDKLGTRKVVLIGLSSSIIAGFAMGVSSVMLAFGVFSLMQGLSQSTGWAPLAKNITNWFSLKERGVVMGWWATNYTIGGLVGAPIAGLAAVYFLDWRFAFFIPSLILIGVLILFYLLQKNKPEDVGLPTIEEYHSENVSKIQSEESSDKPAEGSWQMTFSVIKNPMVLLLGAMYFFLKPTRYAILFWGPLYISESLGTGIAESAIINGAFFLAGPLSVLAGGYASDKLFQSRRMPYSAISMILLAILLFFFNDIALAYNSSTVSAGLLFMLGFFLYGPDSLVSATAAVDFGTSKGASTASGVINGMGSVGAIVGGTIPGFFKATWGWDGVFIALAGSILIAGILMITKWNALPDDVNNN
ncbi:MAG: MFS transporter [Labilibaculum sp.]|nr:MFS transporter [Labilibaculum sp.]MBI9060175.1 MFS transporter [Labilibaculum sp.]